MSTTINTGLKEKFIRLFLALIVAVGMVGLQQPAPGYASAAPASLLEFTAGGHVIGFGDAQLYAAGLDHALNIQFVGARKVTPVSSGAEAPQQVAQDAAPLLSMVSYANLWDGIRLDYRASEEGLLQSTYTLDPGADWTQIRLRYNVPVTLNPDGTLSLAFDRGQMTESAPIAWQEFGGARHPVQVAFSLTADPLALAGDAEHLVGFTLGSYDAAQPLYIDPTLTWNTFLGASGKDTSSAIAADGSGNVYMVGTSSGSWGAGECGGCLKRAYTGGDDTFVTKLDSNGNLVWSTFLGGSGTDTGNSVAVDGGGNVYVAGTSNATWGSPVHNYTSDRDVFAAKLNSDGNLLWNTFINISGNDYGNAIAVDGSGNSYITGFSTPMWHAFAIKLGPSGDLIWNSDIDSTPYMTQGYGITMDGAGNVYVVGFSQGSWGDPTNPFTGPDYTYDVFVVRLNSGGGMVWNTFLGGSGFDEGYGIAVDDVTSFAVYVTGTSSATWGEPERAFTTGSNDAFAAQLDLESGALIWNTFLGASTADDGKSIAVNASGDVFVTGTSSDTWGTPVRGIYWGDTFAAKLDFNSGSLIWNTFLGASGWDNGSGIAIDGSGNVYVAGISTSGWGTPVRAYSKSFQDAYAVKLVSTGGLVWNTFLGGGEDVGGNGIAVDASGNVYVAGYSNGTWGTPVHAFSGSHDAFVAKLDSSGGLTWNTFFGSSAADRGNSIAVDGSGNVFISGLSSATWGTPVRAYSGSEDAFVTKLDPNGALVWNTFLGSAGVEQGHSIVVDGSGNIYTAGSSAAPWGTPVRAFAGGQEAFAAKLDPSGALTWNTFLGSSGGDTSSGLTVDGSGNVYVSGSSNATWGAPVLAFNTGSTDAFAAKLSSNGGLVWNTFLGGSGFDHSAAIVVDGSGNVYATGFSTSGWGTPVRAYSGSDAFVAKLDPSGALTWNTFLGGSGGDSAYDILVDGSGNTTVVGHTNGSSWGAPVRPHSGALDAFAASLSPSGALAWNTFLGSSGDEEYGFGVALDGSSNVYVTGTSTATWGTPTSAFTRGTDAFVAKLIRTNQAALTVVATPATVAYGGTSALSTTGGSGTGAVTFDTGESTGCSVAGSTLSVIDASGTCTVTATKAADTGYNAATSAAATITLTRANQALLTAVASPLTVAYGSTSALSSTGGSGTGAVTFSTGASSGCTVTGSTLSVTNAGGTCAVTATKAADTNYNSATSAARTVTLTRSNQAELTVSASPETVTYGSSSSLSTTGGSGTGAVTYSAGSSTGCSVTGSTLSVTSADGTCAVTATKAADDNYNSASSSAIPVTLAQASPVITWSDAADIAYGTALDATQLNASADVSGSFAYSPAAGAALAFGDHTLHLDFTPEDTVNYTSASKDVNITVTAKELTVTANSYTIKVGSAAPSFDYTVAGFISPDGFLTTPNCSVSGEHTAIDTYPILCSGGDAGVNYTIQYVTGVFTVSPKDILIVTASSAPMVYGGSVPTFTPSYSGFLGIDTASVLNSAPTCSAGSGPFTRTGSPYTVECSGGDDDRYAFSYLPGSLTVSARPITVNVTAAQSKVFGTADPIFAYTSEALETGDTFSGTLEREEGEDVGAYAYNLGSLSAGSNYTLSLSTEDPFEIGMATPTLSVTNSPVVFNGAAQTAVVSGSVAGVVSNVKYNGASTAPSQVGAYAVTADFTPADTTNYHNLTAASAGSFTINAASIVPVLTWDEPAEIVYGTALDATQLHATADVPGDFVYTPAAGTVLPAGVHTIHVDFTPEDTVNYLNTSKEVSLTVTPAMTTVTLDASPNPSSFGQMITLTATVASDAGAAAGTVTFKDGTTTLGTSALSDGAATFSTTVLEIGTHSLTAEYSGDDNYTGSSSNSLTQTVSATPAQITLVSTTHEWTHGQSWTFTVTVVEDSGTPTGTVTLKNGETTLGTGALVNGTATFTITFLPVGTHNITAEYSGGGVSLPHMVKAKQYLILPLIFANSRVG